MPGLKPGATENSHRPRRAVRDSRFEIEKLNANACRAGGVVSAHAEQPAGARTVRLLSPARGGGRKAVGSRQKAVSRNQQAGARRIQNSRFKIQECEIASIRSSAPSSENCLSALENSSP